jgi:HK97 family phage major capsid protein
MRAFPKEFFMPSTTVTAAAILTPEQVQALVVLPLIEQSVAMRAGTVVQTGSHQLRVPRVTQDPSAAWVFQGNEIPVTDPTLDELDIVPKKLAGLTVITNELAADSSPAALQIVGDGLVRDLARKTDQVFFANTTTNGPAGLLSITPTAADAGDAWANLDAFEFAKSNAEQHNTVVDTFVSNPATALKIATLKESTATGSNRALLQPDPTAPGVRTVSGVPLLTSPSIANDIVWALPKARIILALRQGTTVESDRSVFFTSDRTAVRATVRVSWGSWTLRRSPRSRPHRDQKAGEDRAGDVHRRGRSATHRCGG